MNYEERTTAIALLIQQRDALNLAIRVLGRERPRLRDQRADLNAAIKALREDQKKTDGHVRDRERTKAKARENQSSS